MTETKKCRFTKAFIFLSFSILMLFVSTASAQNNLTLKLENTTLKQAFKAIEQKSSFRFVYKDVILPEKKISISVENASIDDILEKLFAGTDLSYNKLNENLIVISSREAINNSQTEILKDAQIIKGTIMDIKGQPIPDASIQEKDNNKNGTTSAKDGSFVIKVPLGTPLIFSYVGYEEQEIKAGSVMKVTLSPAAKTLEDVVVTAMGIERKSKELGYSTIKISGDEIVRATSGNLLSGLVGKVSGLNIATQSADMNPDQKVNIRGMRSFGQTSNNQPLFVFNGMVLSFGADQTAASKAMEFVNSINPADIDNVTILKGANGTALYGPEGVNGVIMITTKKGLRGKPVINFRSSVAFNKIDYRDERYVQRQYGSGTGAVDASGIGIFSSVNSNGWGPKYDGSLQGIGNIDENGEYQQVTYTNKFDNRKFFKAGQVYQNNFSISQSEATTDFYLGLNSTEQKGMLPGDKQHTLNVFFSGAKRLSPKINIQVNFNLSRTQSDQGMESVTNQVKATPAYIPLLNYRDYTNYHWADHNHYWGDIDGNYMSPYERLDMERNKSTGYALVTGLAINFKPLPWLTISEKPSVVYNGTTYTQTSKPVYFSDFAKAGPVAIRKKDILATLREEDRILTTLNNDLLISTMNRFGSNFVFKTTLGNSIRESNSRQFFGNASLSREVYNFNFTSQVTNPSLTTRLTRSFSLFGTANLGYKDRLFVEFMARNDWDSKRAEVARGKDLYIGGNVSAIMNQIIPELNTISWLSRFQLKAAINGTANMNIEPFQSERIMYLYYNYLNADPEKAVYGYIYKTDVPNPLLKPEKILTQEYGVSLGLWKDRVTFDYTYYTQRNSGVIINVESAWASGSPTTNNIGAMRNFGSELDIKINPLFKLPNGLMMTADVHLAWNNNKVLQLSSAYASNPLGFVAKSQTTGTYYNVIARVGGPAFEYQVYDWKKDTASGRYIVDANTGYPTLDQTPAGRIFAGRTLPKFTGGVSINFVWKGFSLGVLGEFSTGAMHYFENGGGVVENGMHILTTYNDRQTYVIPNSCYLKNGEYVDNSDVKVANANSTFYNNTTRFRNRSALFLASADFLRIREIVLGYDYTFKPMKIIKKINLSVYGRNLFNLYAKDNLYGDPHMIKGPGVNLTTTATSSAIANLSGTNSGRSTVPGMIQYGIITSFNF